MAPTPAPALDLSRLTTSSLISLTSTLLQTLTLTPYSAPASAPASSPSPHSLLRSLLRPSAADLRRSALDLSLCSAAIAASEGGDPPPSIFWVTEELREVARGAMRGLASSLGLEVGELAEGVVREVAVELKGVIRESCVDAEGEVAVDGRERPATVLAVIAGLQFRWLVSQVHYPHLGNLSSLVIPCALTALDHWSPEVKEQGMLSFIHIAKNMSSAELGWYEDPILDACCKNIASSNELWHRVMEMTVLFLTSILQGNPRSHWYEKILSEMLNHLERQPMNKDRRISWLLLIEPVLNALGLILLTHFKRIFLLFFQWLHADDDKTLLLVLERIQTIIKLTWIRKSPYFDKLVDELAFVYKEASMRNSRDAIRADIANIFFLLKKCKGSQFEVAWDKHKSDPNLSELSKSISEN